MRKLSRIGATALALALSVAMISPVSVKAYVLSGDEAVYDINRTGTATMDEKGNITRSYSAPDQYKNRITGATWNKEIKDENAEWKAKNYYGKTKKIEIGTDEYYEHFIELETGEKVTAVKVKKGKGIITVKEYANGEATVYPSYDDTTKQLYFTKADNSREVVATLADYPTAEQSEQYKRIQYTCGIRIFGKKAGKAKLQYTVNGKKQTIDIVVSDDARVFQEVKYAGKVLEYANKAKGASNSNNWESQTKNKHGISYVTKKSGKFSAKMGKNYKFVKAYLVKNTPYVTKDDSRDESEPEYGWVDKYTGNHIERSKTIGVDLNGDGDCLDTVYGIDERYMNYDVVKAIKNNKKITLDTSPYQENRTETNTWGSTGGTMRTRTSSYAAKGNMATTEVIVVYQNKITKEFGHEKFYIFYRTSAK